jgi:hypothetical protein
MPLPVLRSKDFVHQPRYQLWTDALCFREMARQAPNNYLRSMCVRNAVLAAWTTLEIACCEALGIDKLGNDFRRGLDEEFDKRGISRLNFGSGVWGKISSKTKDARKIYAHYGVKLSDRFPQVSIAEEAIQTIREAIHDIYGRMGKQSPVWVDFDGSAGRPQTGGFQATAHLTLLRGQLDQNAPETLRIAPVTEIGDEKVTDYFPGTTPEQDVYEQVEDLLGRLNSPFSAVRIYRGSNLLDEEKLDMRG